MQGFTLEKIDRMASVAANFKAMAKEHPIRPSTRNAMTAAVGENCQRVR
jgi:hypothetical protein